jgi:hypothetical protein
MAIRTHLFMAGLLAAAAATAACGGKKGTTLPDEGGGGGGGDATALPGGQGGDGVIVPPETNDEIQRRFDRKRTPVSRCLSAAVDAKELPKSSRGRITLNVTVMPGGKAGEIKVARTTLESQVLSDCVIARVKEIIFPEVPKPYPTSYTYAFEAM